MKALAAVLLCCAMSACSSMGAEDYGVYDPHESRNRDAYDVTEAVDRRTLRPIARGYRKITPGWLEDGIENVFQNLRTVPSAINGFLQGKPAAGATDFARVLVNTTVGVGGFFDPATGWGLRYQEEDFGQTLAVWGMTRSRYVYVPFLGPTTLRDLPSLVVRAYIPRLVLGSDYHWGVTALDVVSARAALLSASDVRDASALDPYVFTRDAYFQRRRFLIYDGQPPLEDLFDEFDEFDDVDGAGDEEAFDEDASSAGF